MVTMRGRDTTETPIKAKKRAFAEVDDEQVFVPPATDLRIDTALLDKINLEHERQFNSDKQQLTLESLVGEIQNLNKLVSNQELRNVNIERDIGKIKNELVAIAQELKLLREGRIAPSLAAQPHAAQLTHGINKSTTSWM